MRETKAMEVERVFNHLYNNWGSMVDIFSIINALGDEGIALMKNENYDGVKEFDDGSKASIKRIGSFIKIKVLEC